MPTTSPRAELLRQMEDVTARLASPTLIGKQRLALLRRQAELGDLREAMADRARRAGIR